MIENIPIIISIINFFRTLFKKNPDDIATIDKEINEILYELTQKFSLILFFPDRKTFNEFSNLYDKLHKILYSRRNTKKTFLNGLREYIDLRDKEINLELEKRKIEDELFNEEIKNGQTKEYFILYKDFQKKYRKWNEFKIKNEVLEKGCELINKLNKSFE